jgi:DNA-binding transcriptional ArsR family regulator
MAPASRAGTVARTAPAARRELAIDRSFAALADPTRRAIVRSLVERPHRAGELADLLRASAPALSRHLRVLREAGLVRDLAIDDDARVRLYELAPAALDPVRGWLDDVEAMWNEQLRSFKAFAESAAGTAAGATTAAGRARRRR